MASPTLTPAPCRILVMASGNGSNFQAIIDAVSSSPSAIPSATIIRLIVNRSTAFARQRAAQHGIPCTYHNLVSHGFLKKGDRDHAAKVEAARGRYDAALADLVLSKEGSDERPQLVVLAGWMHVFGDAFLKPMAKAGIRVINLHPALPGKFSLKQVLLPKNAIIHSSFVYASPESDTMRKYKLMVSRRWRSKYMRMRGGMRSIYPSKNQTHPTLS